MKRIDFLKKFGIGLGVAVVVPQVLAEMPDKEEMIYPMLKDGVTIDTDLLPIRRPILDQMTGWNAGIIKIVNEGQLCIGDILYVGKNNDKYMVTYCDKYYYHSIPLIRPK